MNEPKKPHEQPEFDRNQIPLPWFMIFLKTGEKAIPLCTDDNFVYIGRGMFGAQTMIDFFGSLDRFRGNQFEMWVVSLVDRLKEFRRLWPEIKGISTDMEIKAGGDFTSTNYSFEAMSVMGDEGFKKLDNGEKN